MHSAINHGEEYLKEIRAFRDGEIFSKPPRTILDGSPEKEIMQKTYDRIIGNWRGLPTSTLDLVRRNVSAEFDDKIVSEIQEYLSKVEVPESLLEFYKECSVIVRLSEKFQMFYGAGISLTKKDLERKLLTNSKRLKKAANHLIKEIEGSLISQEYIDFCISKKLEKIQKSEKDATGYISTLGILSKVEPRLTNILSWIVESLSNSSAEEFTDAFAKEYNFKKAFYSNRNNTLKAFGESYKFCTGKELHRKNGEFLKCLKAFALVLEEKGIIEKKSDEGLSDDSLIKLFFYEL